MPLREYHQKRRFQATPEPPGQQQIAKKSSKLRFVIQQHFASRLHYDLRLEMAGVYKSWAIPKGPPEIPGEKRLAVQVEDHPLEYGQFEGVIPEGNYGAGRVLIWDRGTYSMPPLKSQKPEQDLLQGLKKGHLHLNFSGQKLQGEFDLVRTQNSKHWLLLKRNSKSLPIAQNPQAAPHPMLAKQALKPFNHADWLFEIKWDGYRALAKLSPDGIDLFSRSGKSFNTQFPQIAKALSKIPQRAVLDGEIVVLDKSGKPDFGLIQNYAEKAEGHLVYYLFDILEYQGKNLRNVPLIKRKKYLQKLKFSSPRLRLCDYIFTDGEEFYHLAVKNGLEGIMAKRSDSLYLEGVRTNDWLKIKHQNRQEAVIAGITEPKGSRRGFGALVLGIYQNSELKYIGRTGGGFNDQQLLQIKERLTPYFTEQSPFTQNPSTNGPVQWLKPELVCEVKFANWTRDGLLRAPIFLGLRDDLSASQVTNEISAQTVNPTATIPKFKISNPNKIFWPKEKFTKQDLLAYYQQISPYILPYLQDRPQILNRFPNGINQTHFYQKNFHQVPAGLQTVPVFSRSDNQTKQYLICNNQETLLYMANLGCIEIHPWNSRYPQLDQPDYLILDLDPEDIAFSQVIKTAQIAKQVLSDLQITAFCKTSGATGLHIYIPLAARYTTEQSVNFAKLLAELIHQRLPKITSLERSPAKRQQRVYLDYLQNRHGASVAAPYSLRPHPLAPVSTPLDWQEVKPGLQPRNFNLKTIFPRLQQTGDLWSGTLGKGVDLAQVLQLLEK